MSMHLQAFKYSCGYKILMLIKLDIIVNTEVLCIFPFRRRITFSAITPLIAAVVIIDLIHIALFLTLKDALQ